MMPNHCSTIQPANPPQIIFFFLVYINTSNPSNIPKQTYKPPPSIRPPFQPLETQSTSLGQVSGVTCVIIINIRQGQRSSYDICSSTINYYKPTSPNSSLNDPLFLLNPQLLLQLLRVLHLLLLQLLLQVRVPDHVVLAEPVDLEIRVVVDLETAVLDALLHLDLLGQLLVHQLVDFALAFLEEVGVVQFVLEFVEKFEVHQVAVHVLFQHFGVDQVFAAQFEDLLLAHEFVLVVDDLAVFFLEFLGDVVDVGHPLGPGTQLRDEVAADSGCFEGGQQQSAGVDGGEHVDGVVGFDAGEQFAVAVGDLDLFFVAEEDVLGVVVHEVHGVDGFVVGGTDREQFAVESYVVDVEGGALACPDQQAGVVALHLADGGCGLQLAHSLSVPEIPYFQLVAPADEYIELLVEMHGVDVGIGMERGEKLALLQRDPIYLVDGSGHAEIGVDGIVLEISGEVGNSGFVVGAVLGVEIDGSVVLGHHYLAVVLRDDLESDHLAVDAAQTFQREFSSVVDFYLGGVDTGGHDVAFVS